MSFVIQRTISDIMTTGINVRIPAERLQSGESHDGLVGFAADKLSFTLILARRIANRFLLQIPKSELQTLSSNHHQGPRFSTSTAS